MGKSTTSHREKKNPASHAAWKAQNQLDNVNHAPFVKDMVCGCGFISHDKRKYLAHNCPTPCDKY